MCRNGTCTDAGRPGGCGLRRPLHTGGDWSLGRMRGYHVPAPRWPAVRRSAPMFASAIPTRRCASTAAAPTIAPTAFALAAGRLPSRRTASRALRAVATHPVQEGSHGVGALFYPWRMQVRSLFNSLELGQAGIGLEVDPIRSGHRCSGSRARCSSRPPPRRPRDTPLTFDPQAPRCCSQSCLHAASSPSSMTSQSPTAKAQNAVQVGPGSMNTVPPPPSASVPPPHPNAPALNRSNTPQINLSIVFLSSSCRRSPAPAPATTSSTAARRARRGPHAEPPPTPAGYARGSPS